jgi:hypothetical protein
MAVCRGGLGSNENLRTGAYSPGVAYARIGRHPHDYIESFIGDAIGDDFTDNYLNREEAQMVFEILRSAL